MAKTHNKFIRSIGILVFVLSSALFAGQLLDEANKTYNEGDVEGAIPLYRKAALNGENPALCYFNMANAYVTIDSIPQSIVYYKACLSYAPDFFRGHLNLAIAYYQLQDIGACIAQVRRALDINPTHNKALMILAASYRQAGALPEAVATFEQMIALDPQKPEPYVALAELYRELDDKTESMKWLLKYPQGNEQDYYVAVMLAEIYEEKREFARASYYLNLAYEIDNSNKWILYRMVTLHQKSGNDLVALEEAKKGVELLPDFAELALLAGNLSFGLERYNEAEKYYLIARRNGSAGAVVGLDNIRIIRNQELAVQ